MADFYWKSASQQLEQDYQKVEMDVWKVLHKLTSGKNNECARCKWLAYHINVNVTVYLDEHYPIKNIIIDDFFSNCYAL